MAGTLIFSESDVNRAKAAVAQMLDVIAGLCRDDARAPAFRIGIGRSAMTMVVIPRMDENREHFRPMRLRLKDP